MQYEKPITYLMRSNKRRREAFSSFTSGLRLRTPPTPRFRILFLSKNECKLKTIIESVEKN